MKWILFMVIIPGILTLLTSVISGSDFISQLLIGRAYDIDRAIAGTQIIVNKFNVPLAFGFLWSLYLLRRKNERIVSLYFIFSLGLGILSSGGAGVSINLFFDLLISLALILGILLLYLGGNMRALSKYYTLVRQTKSGAFYVPKVQENSLKN